MQAFRNLKSIAECLADEIINASQENPNSIAIKKKDEIERVAKINRKICSALLFVRCIKL